MKRQDKQLGRVLEQRQRVERVRQRNVAQIQSQRVELEARIRAMRDSLTIIRQDLRCALTPDASAGDAVDPRTVRLQAGASLHAQLHVQSLAIELSGVLTRLDRARGELKEAAARRRAVDLLLSRRRAEARRIQERRESVELDEISAGGRARADLDRLEADS